MEYFIIDLATNSDFTSFVNGYQGRIELSQSISISGLIPSTNYFTRILRVKDGRQTPYSYFNFTTNALNAPTAQDATSITYNSFRANWTIVSGVDGYSVDLLNSSDVVISTFTTANNYYDFTGLTELTTYKYRVRSVKGSNQSVNSNTISLSTITNIPAIPTGLTIDFYTNTTAEISFNSVIGATSYKLYIYDAGTPISGYNGKVITITTESVTGLDENKTYTVKVLASNASGGSDLSDEVSFKTKIEQIIYVSNKVTRDYFYRTDFAKSFDDKISSNTTRDERGWAPGRLSSNGRYFAFDIDFYGTGKYQIFIHDFVTDTDIQITADASNTYSSPCWNPNDPDNVYFIKNITSSSGDDTLCKAPIDGSLSITSLRIISNGYYAYNGVFSPDGSVFIWCGLSNAGGTNFYIASLPANNLVAGSITNLETNTTSSNYFYISISNDSQKIYYKKIVSGFSQIFDMDINGSNKAQRTTGSNNKSNPIISFDGSKILYQYTSGSDNQIWVADTALNGSNHYTNNAVWLNNTGNLIEIPSDWGLIQF